MLIPITHENVAEINELTTQIKERVKTITGAAHWELDYRPKVSIMPTAPTFAALEIVMPKNNTEILDKTIKAIVELKTAFARLAEMESAHKAGFTPTIDPKSKIKFASTIDPPQPITSQEIAATTRDITAKLIKPD